MTHPDSTDRPTSTRPAGPPGSRPSADADRSRDRPARVRPRRAALAALVVALAAVTVSAGAGAGAGAGVAAAASAAQADRPTVAVAGASVVGSDVATVAVTLTTAPEGLAGYYLRVTVEDADVARIVGASYPDQFGMTTEPVVAEDGGSVTLEAADPSGAVEPGATDVTLATLTVSGVAPGEAALAVDPLQFDGDGGAAMDPATRADAITVAPADGGSDATEAGSAAGATVDGRDGGGTARATDGDGGDRSIDGGGTGIGLPAAAAAAAVLLVAGLAIGRRL